MVAASCATFSDGGRGAGSSALNSPGRTLGIPCPHRRGGKRPRLLMRTIRFQLPTSSGLGFLCAGLRPQTLPAVSAHRQFPNGQEFGCLPPAPIPVRESLWSPDTRRETWD